MTIHDAYSRLLFQLYHWYDSAEASNIADLVMEKLTGWGRIDRILNKTVFLSSSMEKKFEEYLEALGRGVPVQYVLGECWFYKFRFYVDDRVLIPRPETEELVQWVLQSESRRGKTTVLDVGTGSGCIAISIKKEWSSANMYAVDISDGALEVARLNAVNLETEIIFVKTDILDREQWQSFPLVDVVVSNPPYIPLKERQQMHPRVVGHEPHQALFVPAEDPLLFYRALADFGLARTNEKAVVYAEIHEEHAAEVTKLFAGKGYRNVEIKMDMQGKERFVRALLDA
jgi:release factor glutamine methyltransferase